MSQTASVRYFGKGPREILALHCTLGHAGAWRGLGKVLDGQATITAIDLPGHGRSPDWDGVADLHDVSCEMALPFLREPIDLMGHSFGATVALRLAIEHPEKIRSLTLIEPVFFAAVKATAPEVFQYHFDIELADYARAMEVQAFETATRAFNRLWGDGTAWGDVPDRTRRYMIDRIHLVPAQSPAIIEDHAGLLAAGRLEALSTQTLLVSGGKSPGIIGAIEGALAQRLPHVTRANLPKARHMLPITHPDVLAGHVRQLFEVT